MGKLAIIVMIMVGLMAMMHITGLITSSIWTLESSSIFLSGYFYVALGAGIGLLIAAGAISIGLLGGGSNLVTSAAAVTVGAFGATFIGYMISIINLAKSSGNTWVAYIVFLIMIVIMVGFTIATFDWARGND
jgi:hypothetical protein